MGKKDWLREIKERIEKWGERSQSEDDAEKIGALWRHFAKFPNERSSLIRQRDGVNLTHLHALGRDRPRLFLQVEFPRRVKYLIDARRGQDHEPQRSRNRRAVLCDKLSHERRNVAPRQ
jgi:hypothetical protein